MKNESRAEIGIIGGTGVYDPEIIEDSEEIKVFTPYGSPSDSVTIGTYEDKKIAFIPRHGRGHTIPPHRINNCANIWALKELGVSNIVASSAVGSLREDYKPGEFVLTDQFIDRTRKRIDSFYQGGQLCHISAADPNCKGLREYYRNQAEKLGLKLHHSGTYVCIEGPRFSTRAESGLYRQWKADIIGMTLYPECILAREAEMCYVSIAMVTDYDVWADKPVSTQEIMKTMKSNSSNFKQLIMKSLTGMPDNPACSCRESLKYALI